jgi:hypothetical protein
MKAESRREDKLEIIKASNEINSSQSISQCFSEAVRLK